jgi:hypothetical protein
MFAPVYYPRTFFPGRWFPPVGGSGAPIRVISLRGCVGVPVQQSFSFFCGDDVLLPITIYQADGVTPQNISGWGIQMVIHLPGGPPIVTKATGGGGLVLTTPASGLVTGTILRADTVNLAAGVYLFFVERTDVNTDAVLCYGTLTLNGK